MLNLNDREWKAFFICDIFSLESTSSGIDGNKLSKEQGDIPYLTRTDLNNGYKSFVGQQAEKYKRDSGNCITIGLDTQTAFYQPYSFYTGQNVQVLKNDKLNKYNAKFFIPLLHNAMVSLNWGGNGATLGRLKKKKIVVPITDDRQPDYAFMEQYIREREDNLKQKYIDFVNTEFAIPPTPLDKKKWKAFNLISDEMFYIDEVKTFKSTALVEKSGLLDIVGATSKNNGNVGFLPKQYADYLTKGNCICLIKTGQGSVGDAVYKKGSFIPSNNVCVIRSSWLNKYNGMFIVAEINKQADRYSYGYIRNNPRIRKEQLMLPTTDSGQPDYNYMEQYIKAIMFRKCKNYLEYQNCLIP